MNRDALKKHSDRLYAEQVKARETKEAEENERQTCPACGHFRGNFPNGLHDRSATGLKGASE